jgi:LVIVD repeat
MKQNYLYFLLLLFLFGCNIGENELPPSNVEGYRPVYMSKEKMSTISTLAPQVLMKPGKIYVYGRYLFVGESGKGVHVIDNINPKQPNPISFIEIPSNNDIAIKGDIMYADNAGDLLVFEISNPLNVQLLQRVKDALPNSNYQLPPQRGFFECVDNSKGIVVNWERTQLQSPKCRY